MTGASAPADQNGTASEDASQFADDHASESPAPPTVEVDVDVAELGRAGEPAMTDAGADPAAAVEIGVEASDDAEAADEAPADAETDDDDDDADAEAEDVAPGQGEDEACPLQSLTVRVEALLFASDRPLTDRRMAQLCGLPAAGATARVREALDELDGFLRATGRSFRPRKVAGGWQLVSLPAFGPLMARLHRDRQETRLSPAAMETLAIIAYRQPVLRAELEAIRGVACGEVLRSLLERRMISIVGRAEELGRPMLYGTTKQFLDVFGISSLDDLPEVVGLERRRVERPTPADEADGGAAESADDPVQITDPSTATTTTATLSAEAGAEFVTTVEADTGESVRDGSESEGDAELEMTDPEGAVADVVSDDDPRGVAP